MHQKEYIEEIEVVEIDKPNQKDRKLLPHETQQLWRVAGQLNWVSTQTKTRYALCSKCCKQLHQRCNSKRPSYSEQIY